MEEIAGMRASTLPLRLVGAAGAVLLSLVLGLTEKRGVPKVIPYER